MTITINGYEVNISAKYGLKDKANKHDTMAVLNQISIWAAEASKRYNQIGCSAIGENAHDAHMEIYNQLENKGFYKDVVLH